LAILLHQSKEGLLKLCPILDDAVLRSWVEQPTNEDPVTEFTWETLWGHKLIEVVKKSKATILSVLLVLRESIQFFDCVIYKSMKLEWFFRNKS
jgi:hypothetical protein